MNRSKRVSGPGGPWITIVGVVGDIQQEAPGVEQRPQIYLPLEHVGPWGNRFQDIVLRANVQPMALRAMVLKTLRGLDPEIAPTRIAGMEQITADSLDRERMAGLLFGGFAAVALLLSVVGIFGLVSYMAQQRTREIGIRMALGAPAWDVLRLVAGQGARLVLIGTGIGLLAAFGLAEGLQRQLGELPSRDLYVYLAVTLVIGTSALLACLSPALRSLKVDPIEVLRSE